jgi:signal transduction histidine kinase
MQLLTIDLHGDLGATNVHDGEIWAESILGEGTKFYILVGSFRHDNT